uniref:Uncharacterized protein LOC100187039 n=1 Tax=Phallusia mammillata TaxID=59560 RepID=A0A6F9DJ39_9ASCI|nr:uncharacterized protein LOC100187039 [Phallusia mammillata]
MKTMADCKNQKELTVAMDENLHAIQYFGTCAEQMTDMVFNLCVQNFIALIPATRAYLHEYFEDELTSPEQIQTGVLQFVELFYSSLDLPSEILANYLNHVVLNIPLHAMVQDSILRRKFEKVTNPVTSKHADIITDQESKIQDLNFQIKKARQVHTLLQNKLQDVDKIEHRLLELLNHIKMLNSNSDMNQLTRDRKSVV